MKCFKALISQMINGQEVEPVQDESSDKLTIVKNKTRQLIDMFLQLDDANIRDELMFALANFQNELDQEVDAAFEKFLVNCVALESSAVSNGVLAPIPDASENDDDDDLETTTF